MHSLLALAFIWAGGIGIFIYLMFFFDNAESSKNDTTKYPLSTVAEDKNNDAAANFETKSNMVTDAYVFVNINKKNFLTRFVSTIPSQSKTTVNLNNGQTGSAVKKINKIIKTEPPKKSTDFSIKPAPEI
jgi:hypothetical protein